MTYWDEHCTLGFESKPVFLDHMKKSHNITYGSEDKLPIVDDRPEKYQTALQMHLKHMDATRQKEEEQKRKKLSVDQQFQDYLSQPFNQPLVCSCGGTFGNMRAYLSPNHKH